ncbi:MAG TPA: bifunctional transaldolase/phosoglucose isomerase, partial [Desulfatiglandales bacterium]|nr:bifunctional transaldolase/phosoglucose isomerase [Desulfatiglandales bacterium]
NSLVGPDTVNAVLPATLNAFLDHGRAAETLIKGIESARNLLNRLSGLGVDLDAVTQKLLEDGVASSVKSFKALISAIAKKREQLTVERQLAAFSLGGYQDKVDGAIAELNDKKVLSRIWAYDHTVWKPKPDEITNRLGWLHAPEIMNENIFRIKTMADSVLANGYTHALLLGMGGSSLAPEVFYKTFGTKEGYLDLAVLDSTDPGAVLAHAQRLDPERTLFIAPTKSGTTIETLSFFKFFYNWVSDSVGKNKAGEHFIAVTDPGSPLADLANRYRFRATFLNDPNIGGRYSALSYFGLVPAALLGIDINTLLDRALTMSFNCENWNCYVGGNNYGGRLGVILGELARASRDKVTFIASSRIASFGDWLEQLIAESTGKEGKGILPVVGEPLGSPDDYEKDRLFVHLCLQGDTSHDAKLTDLKKAGHPVVSLFLDDVYDLGGQIFLWEMAVAVAGSCLGINPFNQPDVEASKILARNVVSEYKQKGAFSAEAPSIKHDEISLYGEVQGSSLEEALTAFINQAKQGAYVALQAYIQPTRETDDELQYLRTIIRDRFHLATTVGYGPRFLHSTGQLHKGDSGKGLFIQFTADDSRDAPIPDQAGSSKSSITFGTLKAAQAIGDRHALLGAGRKIIRLHLGKNPVKNLQALNDIFA